MGLGERQKTFVEQRKKVSFLSFLCFFFINALIHLTVVAFYPNLLRVFVVVVPFTHIFNFCLLTFAISIHRKSANVKLPWFASESRVFAMSAR